MNKSDVSMFVRFNFWGNDRILAAAENLTLAQLRRQLYPDPGWGTLFAILVHIMDTEFGWRSAALGQDSSQILKAADFPDLAAVKAHWEFEKGAWFDYLAGLDDEKLNQGYGDGPHSGPKVWQTIMHVVTHGIQHRSEAAYILTGYGHSPGEIDFGVFLRENPEAAGGSI